MRSTNYKVSYITYLHTQLYRHYMNTRIAMEDILWEKSAVNMQLDWEQATKHEKDIVKD